MNSNKIEICGVRFAIGAVDLEFDGAVASILVYYASKDTPILCRKFSFPLVNSLEFTSVEYLPDFKGYKYNTILEEPKALGNDFLYIGHCEDFGVFKIRSQKIEISEPIQNKFQD